MRTAVTIPVDGASLAARSSRRCVATGVGARRPAPAAYGYLYGRHDLAVTRATLPVAGLPPALAGLRIGLLTDVHRSQLGVARRCARARSTLLMARTPDLIVLGGDYVTWGDRELRRTRRPRRSRRCRRRTACSRILGNHDDDHDMPAALARNGVQVLKDARTRLTIRSETIDLAGIRFWTKRQIGHRARSCAARRRRRSCSRTTRAGSPKRQRSTFRWCSPGTRTADRSCCRCSARSRRRSFRSSAGIGAPRADDDVREPRAWERSTCRCASTVRRKSRC